MKRQAGTRQQGLREQIYAVVARIPAGRVASYGQIAVLAGAPGAARTVGWALASTPQETPIPWQRVVNASGQISSRGEPAWEAVQRAMLEGEGIEFDGHGRIDLDRFGWEPSA